MKPQKSKKQRCNAKYQNNFAPKNNNAEDQKNEVLVLPPDLLQKLGINLENIPSSQESSSETNTGGCGKSKGSNILLKTETSNLNVENKYIYNKDKESSILETANLMKASVFLSPTFSGLKLESNNSDILIEETMRTSNHHTQIDDQNAQCNIEEFNANEIKNVRAQISNDEEGVSKNETKSHALKMTIYKHIDNKVSIEESEKKLEEENEHITLPKNVLDSENKIKILSEEVLGFERQENLKNLKSFHKNIMIPATKDTIISINNNTSRKSVSTSSNTDSGSQTHTISQEKHSKACNEKCEKRKHDSTSITTNTVQANSAIQLDHEVNISEDYNFTNINDKVIKHNPNNSGLQNEIDKLSVSLEPKLRSQISIVEKPSGIVTNLQEDSTVQTIAKTNSDICLSAPTEYKSDFKNKQNRVINRENKNYKCDAEPTMCENYTSDTYQFTIDNKNDNKHLNSQMCSVENVNEIDNAFSEAKLPLEDIAFNLSQPFDTDQSRKSSSKNKNSSQSKGNSKLSIQGVEKPGGNLESIVQHRYLKNYSRDKRAKLFNTATVISCKENVGTDIDCKINENNLYVGTRHSHNFCICEDFGSFIHYNLDNSCEHIHFCERKEPQCSVDILLNIYEDNNLEDEYKKENSNIHIVEEIPQERNLITDTTLNICWNNSESNNKLKNLDFIPTRNQEIQNINAEECLSSKNDQCHYVNAELNKCASNNFNPEVKNDIKVDTSILGITHNNNENNITNDVKSCFKNIELKTSNTKKRKRGDQISESESDCAKPNAKKIAVAVRCDAFNSKVTRNEWDDHISKEHCFVAWLEDQELDLQNEELLRKLNKKLCKTNKLICIYCKYEMYEVIKYIKHILKCKRRKCTENNSAVTEKYPGNVIDKGAKYVDHKEQGVDQSLLSGKEQIIKSEPVKVKKENFIALEELQESQVIHNVKDRIDNVEAIAKRLVDESLLQVETEQVAGECVSANGTQVTTIPVLLEKPRQNQIPRVEAEIGVIQAFEVPALPLETGDKQVFEVPISQKETGEEPIFEVPISHIELLDKTVLERSLSQEVVGAELALQVPVETENLDIICGVCKNVVPNRQWIEHISKEHNYIAWKDNDRPLDRTDEAMIRDHLNCIVKEIGELICKECGLKRKFAKSYLKHIKMCQPEQSDTETTEVVKIEIVETENEFTCGVCQLKVTDAQWADHIYTEHDYIAWKEGEPAVDVNDSQQLYDHLFYITKQNDGLECKKCGLRRKYVKSYLKHIETCDGETNNTDNQTLNDSVIESNTNTVDANILELSDDEGGNAICGVCELEVEGKQWLNHIQKIHSYLAWKKGKPPLNLDDDQEIYNYLYVLSKKYNGLRCNKCGANRKYVKAYLSHVESCDSNFLEATMVAEIKSDKDSCECGVCAEVVSASDWKSHAMKKHYNIAWIVGDYPLDVKHIPTVEKCLKEYKELYRTLKCKTCGASRASLSGFYAHIIQCGKTEEETDQYKIYCELCDSKYLCMYKYQHATMHRDQEYSNQQKLLREARERESMEPVETEPLSDRRRAAQKAREFIEKTETFEFNCSSCGYGADDQIELDEHVCKKVKYKDFSESENSADLESSEGEDSIDTAVDSDLSEEIEEEEEEEEVKTDKRRRKHGDSSSAATRVPRVPFAVKCAKSYLRQSADDYRDNFLTNRTLYPQWQKGNMELVSDDESAKYWPILKESCKVIIGKDEPAQFNQFEVKNGNGCSIFVGECIQCISWAPPHVDDCNDEFGHFMAVASHNDVDSPRLDCAKTYEYSGMLQIWDFGDLISTDPEFGLGIAHDYGTIWAIDWCPSGAREVWSPSGTPESTTDAFHRLGLLAIACSNGSAYILSIPYPSSVERRAKSVYKVTPVAELRLSRGERGLFQATSISWSTENDHETVIVGYSDGTIALYNLNGDSPLLTDIEGGVNIFYPFQDERPHNSSIVDVKTFPSSLGAGLISSSSPTGSAAARRGARVHGHLSSTGSAFAPHWPSLIVTGNETIVNQSVNELDWWGVGRRTGGVQTGCGCMHCGIMAMFTSPVLRLMTTHPVYSDFNKQPIAVCQMKAIGQKRPKKKNDDFQLKLEPFSYSDAVKTYALEFKLIKDLDKEALGQINMPKERFPERFPLSDIPSMAFCRSPKQHRKLAVATHAGIIFIVTV